MMRQTGIRRTDSGRVDGLANESPTNLFTCQLNPNMV